MLARSVCSILLFGLIGAGSVGAAQATVSGGQLIANNTPKFAAGATDLGSVNPSSVINVSVWLNVHNRSELDSLAQSLYDPSSPNFRHWLSHSNFVAQFAPTAAEAKTVQTFLASQNLTVVSIGPDNFFVRASGTVAAVQSAFHVAIHQFQVGGQTYRGNTSDPTVTGPAGALVSAVYGLDNLQYTHPFTTSASAVAKLTPPSGAGGLQSGLKNATASASADAESFSSVCFTGVRTESFTTGGALPDATFTGNGYTQNPLGCGYTPAEIRTAYNLNGLYKEGFDGTGQTIVIVDWCGSPTIQSDANAFSAKYGLPALTASNFKIINYPSPSYCSGPDGEINLDVEWAHAVAPGAAIDLLVPPTATFDDVDAAMLYAAVNHLGNIISGSFGSEEFFTPTNILATENSISEVAALFGESANFSTGDAGDFTYDFPSATNPASVSAPADSPWATAVGGVTVALNSNNSIKFQTGWGTNINFLISEDSISDPPTFGLFDGGSGGGPSAVFKKPLFQSKLPGKYRQLPDISWVADPYTGVIIAISEPLQPLVYEAVGGTSVACPMFSALWAIANQEAGMPLGQAAAYLYSLPANAITDVVPYNSTTNVTATITDFTGTTTYSASAVAAPLGITTKYMSALWDFPLYQDTTYLLTFGTDSGLTTTVGWDNVTGLGTPNGKAFADAFAAWAP